MIERKGASYRALSTNDDESFTVRCAPGVVGCTFHARYSPCWFLASLFTMSSACRLFGAH